MYNLSKEEKLKFVLETQKELRLSANTISKNTNLTEAGVQRILNGTSKNPQENSLNKIIEFFTIKISGEKFSKETPSKEKYIIVPEITELQQQIINMYKEHFEFRAEIARLEKILEENSIKY